MQWHMPIGYKVVDGKITICEEQRKIVEQIFTDYDSRVAAGRIAQNLKGRNICNAKGKVSWTHASIGRILENQATLAQTTIRSSWERNCLRESSADGKR